MDIFIVLSGPGNWIRYMNIYLRFTDSFNSRRIFELKLNFYFTYFIQQFDKPFKDNDIFLID